MQTDFLLLMIIGFSISSLFGLIAKKRPIPPALSGAVFVVCFTVQGALMGWLWAVISAAICLVLFGLLFWTGILGRSGTYALPALLALLPVGLWWALIPGLASATLASAWGIARTTGKYEVTAVVIETSNAIKTQSPKYLRDIANGHAADQATAKKVNLFAHLAYGFAAIAAVALVVLVVR